jgi:hypothetical protein
MQQWWDQNKRLIPKGYSEDEVKAFKDKVEDLTGSIPLLLKECVWRTLQRKFKRL